MIKLIIKAYFAVAVTLFLGSCETLQLPESAGNLSSRPNLLSSGLRRTGKVYTGKASWYSVRTNGGTATASGERFRNDGMTAAHKTLPLGTMVEVTNLLNQQSMVVRINDRGPYIHGRIIDLSIGVAGKFGFVNRGVIPVKIEVLEQTGSRTRSSALKKRSSEKPANLLEFFGLSGG